MGARPKWKGKGITSQGAAVGKPQREKLTLEGLDQLEALYDERIRRKKKAGK